MGDRVNEPDTQPDDEQLNAETRELSELSDRRDFLRSLGKWSTAAIAAILVIESSPANEPSGWVNRRASGVNGPGAGGWANRSGSWANGGDTGLNSGTNSINRGGSGLNGGGDWTNRGGGGWLNSRGGGGSWVNRRG
jgi:hypothetical protein